VRLLKLIEYEERADEIASNAEANTQTESYRKVKGYRIKYFDILRETIQTEMNRLYTENNKDLTQVIESFDSIIDLLIIVHDDITPLFPPRYNIFHFFVLEYHRAIHDMVIKCLYLGQYYDYW
jgi:hypothetical protein